MFSRCILFKTFPWKCALYSLDENFQKASPGQYVLRHFHPEKNVVATGAVIYGRATIPISG
jgi:hypothetical protein